MSTINIDNLDVPSDASAINREGDHVVMIVPASLAFAIKTATEIMSVMLLDPELHKGGDRQRLAVAIQDSVNLAAFASGLTGFIEDQITDPADDPSLGFDGATDAAIASLIADLMGKGV